MTDPMPELEPQGEDAPLEASDPQPQPDLDATQDELDGGQA